MVARRETSGKIASRAPRPEGAKGQCLRVSAAPSVRKSSFAAFQTFHVWLPSFAAPARRSRLFRHPLGILTKPDQAVNDVAMCLSGFGLRPNALRSGSPDRRLPITTQGGGCAPTDQQRCRPHRAGSGVEWYRLTVRHSQTALRCGQAARFHCSLLVISCQLTPCGLLRRLRIAGSQA